MATIISHSPEDTLAFGEACGRAAGPGAVFALDGDLGAGKTHFVKGLLHGLGYADEVTSPTFTLVHEYPSQPFQVFHFDFYRLDSTEEVLALDFDDYLSRGGVVIVEWASKFPEVFPPHTRWMRFEIGQGDERRIVEAGEMIILALDTTTNRGAIALLQDGVIVFDEVFPADRSQSSQLFPMLERARQRAPRVDLIAIGLGPGSYAGARIAIAAAIGFARAVGAELVGLPSVAALETDAENYLAIGDARLSTFYFTRVERGICVEGPILLNAAELDEQLAKYPSHAVFSPAPLPAVPRATIALPRASTLAQLAAAGRSILQRGDLEPLYLRDPHITTPKAKPEGLRQD